MAYVYVFQGGGENLFRIVRLATGSLGPSALSPFR